MTRKAILVITAILSCCALMCVGFSSWSFAAADAESSVRGGLSSEDIIMSNSYIAITKVEPFTYTQFGFRKDGGTSYVGTMTVLCTVKDAEFLTNKASSLCLEMTLPGKNDLLLQSVSSVTISSGGTVDKEKTCYENGGHKTVFRITDSSLSTLTLTYTFSAPAQAPQGYTWATPQDWYKEAVLNVFGNKKTDESATGFAFRIVITTGSDAGGANA